MPYVGAVLMLGEWVDFHYTVNGKTYEYNLLGGSYINLEDLLKALNIFSNNSVKDANGNPLSVSDFMKDVDNVSFSNDKLVWVGKAEDDTTVGKLAEDNKFKIEYSAELTEQQISEINDTSVKAGDWALISLKSFDTEESLTISMKNGDKFEIMVTDPNPDGTGNLMDPSNYVDVKGDGITIKLFDYTGTVNGNNIDTVWGNSVSESNLRSGTGVNNGRTLLFSGSGLSNQNWWNNFSGVKDGDNTYYSGIATQGIVANTLGADGYPVLSSSVSSTNESLGYLFGAGGQDGVTTYAGSGGEGLTGLLQKDSNGYYYYSSEENYARLNSTGDQIQLYTDTYNKAKGSSNSMTEDIGFFPFTDYNSNKTEEKGPNDAYYDHQFGMSIDGKFTYPTDGYLPDANGNLDTSNPLVFNFKGDDDVWVFIDDVLVLDLGGVHSPLKGSINFATGVVTIYEYDAHGNYSYTKNTTIQAMFAAAGKSWNPEAYSEHKFDFFYLERGGCDSNCILEFNLLTRTNTNERGNLVFDKVDENDEPLEGAKFQLFTNENCTTALTWVETDESGTKTAVAVSTADATGNVKFNNIPTGNYYMKEIEAPSGYAVSDRVYEVYVDADSTKSYVKYNNQTITKITNVKAGELTVKKRWQNSSGQQGNPAAKSVSIKLHRKKPGEAQTATLNVHIRDSRSDILVKTVQTTKDTVSIAWDDDNQYSWDFNRIVWSGTDGTGISITNITESGGHDFASFSISGLSSIAGQTKDIYFDYNVSQTSSTPDYTSGYISSHNNGSIKESESGDDLPSAGPVEDTFSTTVYLNAAGNWLYTWKIGGKDSDYNTGTPAYDIPATDDNGNAYLYYITELDSSGNDRTIGVDTDGYKLLGYSNNNTEGVSNQGYIIVTNESDVILTDISIKKVKEDGATGLPNAVFQLKVKDGTDYREVNSDDGIGGLTEITEGDQTWTSAFKSDGNTKTLTSLPDGNYQLTEVLEPAGYVNTFGTIEFNIANGEVILLSPTSSDKLTLDTTGDIALITVTNEPGQSLPNTGGIGTHIFYIVGSLLMIIGGTWFVVRRYRTI